MVGLTALDLLDIFYSDDSNGLVLGVIVIIVVVIAIVITIIIVVIVVVVIIVVLGVILSLILLLMQKMVLWLKMVVAMHLYRLLLSFTLSVSYF